jgi:hypothetical protein
MDNPAEVTYIGKTDFRNSMTPFGIKAIDRTKHMYIIGKTGTGKSTFLENMILQDIRNGNGLAFIDPHGGSAERLLDYIPEDRIKDVIYLNPSDTDFPVAFNPLEDTDPERRPLVVDGLMTVFKKIWPEAFSGRMEYILNNTMLALLEYPNPTLLSINRFLTDKDFRKRVVANIQDPTVKNAWEELGRWDDKRWSEATGALINKVGQFTTNPLVRNIVGQPQSTFDFRKAMDERKIIIINLSKGKIGEQNQPLFGAMLITKIYLAAMSRAELSAAVMDKMPPFYFYVDEFQNFANDSFANILSEARKYKLCLTVANQYVAQMEETIRDAVFGNMGTTVAFRVGPLDSELLEKVFTPVFTANDLENLQFGQFYVTLQIDNMGSRPFSALTMGPLDRVEVSHRAAVIAESQKQFSRPRKDVEDEIIEWFGYNKKESKPLPVAPSATQGNTAVAIQPLETTAPKTTKYVVADKSKTQTRKPVEKTISDKPAPLSSKMNDLLGQLESSVTENISAKPVEKPEVKKVELPKIEPVTPVTTKTLDKPVKDRAAKPETKNALLEALEKAKKIKDEEKAKAEQKPKTPTSDLSLKDMVTDVEHVETIIQSAETAEKKPIEKTVEKKVTENETHAVREVPEDILKKILE